MRFFITLAIVFAAAVTRSYSQWADLRYMQMRDQERILQYHQERMRAAGIFPDSSLEHPALVDPVRIKDFVTIENPPTRAKANYMLRIRYQCSKPQFIILFMDGNEMKLNSNVVNASMPVMNDPDVIFFRKYWPCYRSRGDYQISMPLKFPPSLLMPPNILLPKAWHLQDAKLKVAMVDEGLWKQLENAEILLRDLYHVAFEKSLQSLALPIKVAPPFSRSKKELDRCLSWPYEIYDMLYRTNPPKSPADNVVTQFLRHPVISPMRQYGLPRNFMRFYNPELRMPPTPKDPRYTFSIVFYLASQCSDMCSLFQHIDDKEEYDTPAIFMNSKGQLQLQARLVDDKSYAFNSDWSVPVGEWVRVDIQHSNVMYNVTLLHGKNFTESKNLVRMFHKPMKVDYLAGYFSLGGSLFSKCINGIIGSGTLWRNMIISSEQIPLPSPDDEMFSTGVESFLEKSKEIKNMINRRWRFLTRHQMDECDSNSDICVPYFLEVIRDRSKLLRKQICLKESQPLPSKYGLLEKQLEKLSKKSKQFPIGDIHGLIGDRLYARARKTLESPDSIERMKRTIAPLQQAAALLHGPSCFLLYVIYANGFGTEIKLEKARTYLHVGALVGERMCIKTLAYKHTTGDDGFDVDDDIAFYYYFNAAQVTQGDRQNHEEGMTEINRVRLTDERQLKQQTSEGEDLFQWFKHQAGSGVNEAKRNLGQLLYWGKQGLKRNLKAAFEYYEQAAQDTEDPDALYDYGITLMKGHGTEVDEAKALEHIQKAADKNFPGAFNTLGWYYIRKDNDKKRAAEYFEKANELDNVDAAYNLAHMHYLGDYPGGKRDMTKAFPLYYKAASRGHIEACVRVSYMFATGIRDYLYRNIQNAIHWSRPVAEMSPVMGEILREALQSFRANSWTKSTLLYLAAAETGFEIAGYNTAFLCEENKNKLVRQRIAKDSVWRFWNNSARQYGPPPYALNKIGDYHYYGVAAEPNLTEALQYYVAAVKMRDPQALFNMAVILEEHADKVDNETLRSMGLPEESLLRTEDTILELYQTCSNLASEENAVPCYMGLIRMKFIVIWKFSPFWMKLIATLFVIGISTLVVFASTFLRHQRHTDTVVLSEQGTPDETTGSTTRTRLLQNELIEHETGEIKSKSHLEELDEQENEQDVDAAKLQPNGDVNKQDATGENHQPNGATVRKSDLEEESSCEDDCHDFECIDAGDGLDSNNQTHSINEHNPNAEESATASPAIEVKDHASKKME